MPAAPSTLLIAGASHVGKSTLGVAIGNAVGCDVRSTDEMARHPGRPWPKVPPHVEEFYAALSNDSIFQFLLNHHENMWPHIKVDLVARQANEKAAIFEGSALRPEYLATLMMPDRLITIVLHAPHSFLQQRIHANSGYSDLTAHHQSIVDKFVDRTVRDNDANVEVARRMGIRCIDASNPTILREVKRNLVERLKAN